MNRVIVTGATGFIGHHLVRELAKNKDNYIYAVVRPSSEKRNMLIECENVEVTECALETIAQLPKLVPEPIDIFYHLAWGGIHGNQRDNGNLQRLNYQYTIETINTAGKMCSKTFIGLGSQAEYGYCNGKITEMTPTIPTTEYGKSKLQTCLDGQIIAGRYTNMNYIWPRLFSAYGPGDSKDTMIMSVLEKMLQNEDVIITSSGTQLWDYLYISDLISMLIDLQNVPSGIYNLASGKVQMLKEYVYDMAELTDFNGDIIFGTQKIENRRPSINKLLSLGVNKPKISFRKGIKEILTTMTSSTEQKKY